MICYTVVTYVDGSHGRPFYVLVNEPDDLDELCDILQNSKSVQHYEILEDMRLYRDGAGLWTDEWIEEI